MMIAYKNQTLWLPSSAIQLNDLPVPSSKLDVFFGRFTELSLLAFCLMNRTHENAVWRSTDAWRMWRVRWSIGVTASGQITATESM